MTRQELEKLTKEELVEKCFEQGQRINELRGYDNGMRPHHYSIFDKEELIDLYLETEEQFFGDAK